MVVLKLTLDIKLDDEEQKKKVLGVFNVSFFNNLVGGGHSFFNFCLGGLLRKSLE